MTKMHGVNSVKLKIHRLLQYKAANNMKLLTEFYSYLLIDMEVKRPMYRKSESLASQLFVILL
jgi:hypothetical protein